MFQQPTPADVRWDDLLSLFRALGVAVSEGAGSRFRFDLNGITLSLHRPHPESELKRYAVRDAARFLTNAGVQRP